MLCLNCRHALVRVVGFDEEDNSPVYVITCIKGDDSVEYDVVDCNYYQAFNNYFNEELFNLWKN